jgi:MYXO-CTERM domain-containing protein
MFRGWVRAGIVLSIFLAAPSASAFCRSRACEFDDAVTVPCKKDHSGCPTNGAELYWPTPSFDMWVDHRGSQKSAITGEQTREVLQQALGTWMATTCGTSAPSIAVGKIELMEDDARIALALTTPTPATSDDPAVTTSVVAFVDKNWVKETADAIALTTTSFGTKSGRIFGADIEIDSDDFLFTLDGDPSPQYDLLAVLTHETGHVLGLADLQTAGPTMYGHYSGHGNVDPRDLDVDDETGLCTIYPAGRFDSEGGCGCRMHAAPTPGAGVAFGFAALGLLVRRRRTPQRGVSTTPSAPPK